MPTLFEADVYVLIICYLRLIMRLQDLVRVGTDLGLVVKIGDPDINEEIGSPTKVTSDENVCMEVVLVVLFGVRWVVVTFG